MDLLTLHFARHALAQQAVTNPVLLPALAAADAEIAERVSAATSAGAALDHGAMAAALCGVARSGHWHSVEVDFLSKNPTCAACGTSESLNVHHRFDFHEAILLGRPDLELDERNLITLCVGPMQHHVLLGHLDSYLSFNPTVAADIVTYRGWDEARIRGDAAFRALVVSRAPPWEQWSPALKDSTRALWDATLPPDPQVLARYDLPTPTPATTWQP